MHLVSAYVICIRFENQPCRQTGRQPLLNKIRSLVIALVILVVLAGAGLAVLQFWDPPAPSAEVEKDLPNDALQK